MTSEFILYCGLALCILAVVGTVIAVIVLYAVKSRLNKKLETEYGKRRH